MELSQCQDPLSGKHYRLRDSVFTYVIFTHICHVNNELQTLFPLNTAPVSTSICPICTSCLVWYRWHCEVTPWKQHCAALQYVLTSPKPRSVHLIMLSSCRGCLTLDFAHSTRSCFHSLGRTRHVLALRPPCPNSCPGRTARAPYFSTFAATLTFAHRLPHCCDISPLHYREGCL